MSWIKHNELKSFLKPVFVFISRNISLFYTVGTIEVATVQKSSFQRVPKPQDIQSFKIKLIVNDESELLLLA